MPVTSRRRTTGSVTLSGSSPRTSATASLMSLTARSLSVSSSNSTTTETALSDAVTVVWRTPTTEAMASSSGCATCATSSEGAAPGWPSETVTMGKSIFGNCVTASVMWI